MSEVGPAGEIRFETHLSDFQLQPLSDTCMHSLSSENERNVVDVGHIVHGDDVGGRHVAEGGDLALGALSQQAGGAADDEVGGQA